MKNKITVITLVLSLFSSFTAFAQQKQRYEENFANKKAKIISHLNQEKSIIETEISCIKSAENREATEKCRDTKKSSMEALKQKEISERKEYLQDELNKLNDQTSKENGIKTNK